MTSELEQAQTRKALADAQAAEVQADLTRVEFLQADFDLNKCREEERRRVANYPGRRGIFRLTEQVSGTSVDSLLCGLDAYHETTPEGDITIDYRSPGGNVLAGFDLYDYVRRMSRAGHYVTTRVAGYSASMAGVLLQAGDRRVIGAQSHLHLHEVSSAAIGKVTEMMDAVEFSKKLTHQICQIYIDRAGDKATMTSEALYEWIERRERWLNAEEALAYGFVDEIE